MRRLLSPRWLGLHALVLVLVVAFCRLGWWQWDRSRSPTGGVQNLIYALQWPSFAVFALVMWWKTMRDELHPPVRDPADADPLGDDLALRPRPVPPPAYDEADATADEELAAYNRYLAWLHEQDQRSRR